MHKLPEGWKDNTVSPTARRNGAKGARRSALIRSAKRAANIPPDAVLEIITEKKQSETWNEPKRTLRLLALYRNEKLQATDIAVVMNIEFQTHVFTNKQIQSRVGFLREIWIAYLCEQSEHKDSKPK